ncbi:MAG: DUF2382 domain-containing protein [Nostocales cyanobacterium]|nr:MAG: DUF2382 domain-containing protein [Nostocales cyanobacterium]TAF16423.1 MAG: DUF2382 domain-containing protein [Nostocales cyanobacterium]
MVLHKLADFEPNYLETFADDKDIKDLEVYAERTNEKIGKVHDILVDDTGKFRYLVVDLGFWIFGKKVLLPIARTHIDYNNNRVYAIGLNREKAEELPEFDESIITDYHYEEHVRNIYRQSDMYSDAVETSDTLESSTPLETSGVLETPTYVESTATTTLPTTKPTYTRDTYRYEHEPELFALNDENHQTFKLYEERLIASKHRRKMGEVRVSKHIEMETAKVSVPVEKEHIVIEHIIPENANQKVFRDENDFNEGEVTRMEVYEETPDVRKETFVKEEIRIKKVVERENFQTQDTVRKEELDINSPNLPIEER